MRNSVRNLQCEQPRGPGGSPAAAWVMPEGEEELKDCSWRGDVSDQGGVRHPASSLQSASALPGERRALGGSQPPQEQGGVWRPTD